MSLNILTFSVPELKDRKSICETLFHVEQSDLAFPNLYLLRNKYGTTIALHKGVLYRHYTGNGRLQGYSFPVGVNLDINDALFHVEQHAAAHGYPLHFCLLTEENARILKERYGEKITITCDPGDADYVYRKSDLAELPGTAFHKKRNHISRFERMFPNWVFTPLTDENASDALRIAHAWVEGQDASENHFHELRAIENALHFRHELGIFGGLLYVENTPAAFALVSEINPRVVDIHYEKCTPQYRDAYPVINREMAKWMSAELINREEDLNIPGLRQAKLSYKPTQILHKFRATVTLC